jgi:chaperone required for assembly of F1-ATPase
LVSASNGPRIAGGREARALPKRVYKAATVAAAQGEHPAAFRILLDRKPARTPAKALLAVPTKALAEAIASEWELARARRSRQHALTRLANSAIDGVRVHTPSADIVTYAASDLLCYRASELSAGAPASQVWDPVLA